MPQSAKYQHNLRHYLKIDCDAVPTQTHKNTAVQARAHPIVQSVVYARKC